MPEDSEIPIDGASAGEVSKPNALESDLIWAGNDIKVKLPQKPAMPREEGLHFIIDSASGEGTWRDRDIREVLKETYFSLPVARIVSEANMTPDFWANIQLKSALGFDKAINVIGRNPGSESSWVKPPVAKDVSDQSEPVSDELKELVGRYLPLWDKSKVSLFEGGVNEIKADSEDFVRESESRNMDILWMNDKYTIDVVKRPHLTGLHLVVSQREQAKKDSKISRPWEVSADPAQPPAQRQDFLEEMAIILSAQRVLWEAGVPYFNPEIQFNGNWTPAMQPAEKGGVLTSDKIDDIVEKRSHRQHHEKDWNASAHGHLYATSSPTEYVGLPSRPEAEVPQEWEGIVPASAEEIASLRGVLQTKLTPYLEQNAQGAI